MVTRFAALQRFSISTTPQRILMITPATLQWAAIRCVTGAIEIGYGSVAYGGGHPIGLGEIFFTSSVRSFI